MSRPLRATLRIALVPLLFAAMPAAVLAQAAAQPIDPPPGFAEVRAKYESLTPAQVAAAGYAPDPGGCISSPMGGMGIHAINRSLHESQFATAQIDPENPPILLLSADSSRVVGLEWEAKDIGQGAMELYGQAIPLLPGHPGIPEPHYMLHAYFRPNGQVLFAEWDPELSCQLPTTATDLPALGWQGPALQVGMLAVALGGLAWLLRRPRARR